VNFARVTKALHVTQRFFPSGMTHRVRIVHGTLVRRNDLSGESEFENWNKHHRPMFARIRFMIRTSDSHDVRTELPCAIAAVNPRPAGANACVGIVNLFWGILDVQLAKKCAGVQALCGSRGCRAAGLRRRGY